MKLIAVAELPDGSNVQVQGLLVSQPQSALSLEPPKAALVPTRPLSSEEAVELFMKLCEAGRIESPMQVGKDTVWREVKPFGVRVRKPNAAGNGAGQAKRIIVPGG